MNALDELKRVRADLASERNLEDIWNDRPLLWQGLEWDRAQLRLWLRSLPKVQVRAERTDNPAYRLVEDDTAASRTHAGAAREEDLGEIIAEVLESLGKPAPLTLVRAKLPPV